MKADNTDQALPEGKGVERVKWVKKFMYVDGWLAEYTQMSIYNVVQLKLTQCYQPKLPQKTFFFF